MSISNRHTVVPFIAGTTKPMTGQRLAKIGYKTTKNQKAKFDSIAVSVPKITDDQIIPFSNALLPYVRNLLEGGQDGIIRSLYESRAGKLDSVSDEEISIAAVISYFEAENTGGRLTKESLENWFDSELKESVIVLLADKLGFPDDLSEDQEKVINQHMNAYRGLISSLSGGATVLGMKQINGIKVVLNTAAVSDDEIAQKLNKRLDGMIEMHKKNEEIEMLL